MSKKFNTEDLNEQRKVVMNAYPGQRWHERVLRMRPAQIFAIFQSMRDREKKIENNEEYHQIDMFEYLADKGEK